MTRQVSVHLSFKLSVAMARFIGLFFALLLSNHLLPKVNGQCSTLGTRGLTGCECLFLGACDVNGKQKVGLNMSYHLPSGLELLGHAYNALAGPNLAYLCEDRTVGILYDCNNRIPLYAATVIRGSQLSGADDSRRPKSSFSLSKSGLHKYFQQSSKDYAKSSKRKICYKSVFDDEIVDVDWYRAKNLILPLDDGVCGSSSDDVKVIMHKGHLVASRYGLGDRRLKKATFVYTNVVPQFGDYNSVPWQIAEGTLVVWGQNNCAKSGTRNVQMFIIVGVIPSTIFGPSKTRYFGSKGFSDYQHATDYRVNVPALMWTAACCTFEFTEDGGTTWQAGVRSTAFWRMNVPGKLPAYPVDVKWMEWMLKQQTAQSEINLFPNSDECKESANFISLI